MFPFFEKAWYINKEHYSIFFTFEIATLLNVPGHYLRKYGILKKETFWKATLLNQIIMTLDVKFKFWNHL